MEVLIDFKQVPLDLPPEDLEAYSLRLADELSEVADRVGLVRLPQTPEDAMAGEAKFDLGILKAEVNFENLKKVLDWLGNLFYGRTLELEYEEAGRKTKLKYRTDAELAAQVEAIAKMAAIPRINIKVTGDVVD